MSARSKLPVLPGDVDVFASKKDLYGGGKVAPMKRGITGWALFAGRLAECVTFRNGDKNNQWKISQLMTVRGSDPRECICAPISGMPPSFENVTELGNAPWPG